MSDWKIDPRLLDLPLEVLNVANAMTYWKRLSKPAQAAVEAAYPDGLLRGHGNTILALERHGFAERSSPISLVFRLTDAGRAVARWNLPKVAKP